MYIACRCCRFSRWISTSPPPFRPSPLTSLQTTANSRRQIRFSSISIGHVSPRIFTCRSTHSEFVQSDRVRIDIYAPERNYCRSRPDKKGNTHTHTRRTTAYKFSCISSSLVLHLSRPFTPCRYSRFTSSKVNTSIKQWLIILEICIRLDGIFIYIHIYI